MTTVRAFSQVVLVALVAACSSGPAATPAPSAFGASASTSATAATPAYSSASASVGGSSLGGTVQPGETLCGLLGPGDFAAVGLVGAGVPTLNGDGTTEAYCVYAGKSSGTGGIEFDAFAGTTADAPGTYQTVVGEGRGGQDAASLLPGADAAAINLASDGGSAVIAVRAGKLVFAIGFPASDRAKSQLTTLAQLVLERAAAIR